MKIFQPRITGSAQITGLLEITGSATINIDYIGTSSIALEVNNNTWLDNVPNTEHTGIAIQGNGQYGVVGGTDAGTGVYGYATAGGTGIGGASSGTGGVGVNAQGDIGLRVVGDITAIDANGAVKIVNPTDASALYIANHNQGPWLFQMFNNTYSTSSVLEGGSFDTGEFLMGNSTDRPIEIYNNSDYVNPTLILSSSGVTVSKPLQQGYQTIATGQGSHAEGVSTLASGDYSHAEGYQTTAIGQASHAEGLNTIASGSVSHAEGESNTAFGDSSHAEGYGSYTQGNYSHAEGYNAYSIGDYSHAEGSGTISQGIYSHAEGEQTIAGEYASHAEGYGTKTQGTCSHAEGIYTVASGYASHAEGLSTSSSGDYSHAEGFGTVALGNYQHVQGTYNLSSSAAGAFIHGNGTGPNGSRSNLIFASGSQVQITGSLKVSGAITGSLFGTSSWAISSSRSISSSYSNTSTSASYALSASWAPGGAGATPQGVIGAVQYNNAGVFAGASNVNIISGTLNLVSIQDPVNLPTASLFFYSKDIAGRQLPKWVGPSGVATPVQPNIMFNQISLIGPGGGTTVGTLNCTVTTVGTISNPNITTTNLKAQTRRVTNTSSATAGSLASTSIAALECWRGNVAGQGGFFSVARFGFTTLAEGQRMFIGLDSNATAAPTNIDYLTTTTTGKIGMYSTGSTGNWVLLWNAVGAVPTTASLGSNFPVDTTSMFEMVLFARPNDTVVSYRLTNLSTATLLSGSISTNLPANTVPLGRLVAGCNNATTASMAWDLSRFGLETDY